MTDRVAMVAVERIACRVAPFEWRFPLDARERIEAHWSRLRDSKPGLFDGRVLMARSLDIDTADGGATLRGLAFETGYKAFISWRDFGWPDRDVSNLFAMAALRSADGAFMLGRMSAATANAGRLYFAAGTPEPSDADADGCVDFDRNILRELEEETGIAATEVALDPTWTIVFAGPLVACMRIARSNLPAAALARRAAAFIEAEEQPELDALVAVRGESDLDEARMPPFMLRYLRTAFAAP